LVNPQVRPGGADRSYGIEAGRLAGLPASVIQRAKQVMGQIEKHSHIAVGLRQGNPSAHDREKNVQEKNGKSERLSESKPTEQLDIFG
jgi:DNA mismatch repair protein MutS